MSIPQGSIIWGVRFEGVGNTALASVPGTSDDLYRFADAATSGDTRGLYLPYLRQDSPGGFEQSINFRTGKSSISAIEIGLLVRAKVRDFFAVHRPQPVARLTANLAVGATSIALGSGYTTGAGKNHYIKREAIYLSAHLGSGLYTCVRGVLGTAEERHDTARPNEDLEVCDRISVLSGRKVELFYVVPGGGYSDEVVIWNGVVDDVDDEDKTSLTVQCIGSIALARDPVIPVSQWTEGKRA